MMTKKIYIIVIIGVVLISGVFFLLGNHIEKVECKNAKIKNIELVYSDYCMANRGPYIKEEDRTIYVSCLKDIFINAKYSLKEYYKIHPEVFEELKNHLTFTEEMNGNAVWKDVNHFSETGMIFIECKNKDIYIGNSNFEYHKVCNREK